MVNSEDDTPYTLDKRYRDSWTAYLNSPEPEENDDDMVVRCVEERASTFQGDVPIDHMEQLQVVKSSLLLHIN